MTTSTPPLPPVLAETGSVLRREALEYGLSAEEVERLLAHGVWVRIRRGTYATRDAWGELDGGQRHRILSGAVVRVMGPPAVLGHESAAVLHGLPTWGMDLSAVHVVRGARGHGSRRQAGVMHHASQLPSEHVVEVDGVPVTSPARTIADLARELPFEPAVVVADACLHQELATEDEIRDLMLWQSDWPGSRGAARALSFADALAESVLESRGRVRMANDRLPEPELQVDILDEAGAFVARADFLIRRHSTVIEADGRLKYRAATAGRPLEDVLWAEKRREDALRALGYEVVRFTWDDLAAAPELFRRRILAAFARAAGRPAPLGSTRPARAA